MARRPPDVARITSASPAHSVDLGSRQRRYVVSMTIRTVCFLVGVITIPAWYAWVFLVASIFLPYVAVVMANAGSSPDPDGPDPYVADERRPQLGTGPADGSV